MPTCRRPSRGGPERVQPGLRHVADTIYRHGELMVAHFDDDENKAMREIRKHMAWYFKGYPVGGDIRGALGLVESLAELRGILDAMDLDSPFPGVDAEGPRGRQGTPKARRARRLARLARHHPRDRVQSERGRAERLRRLGCRAAPIRDCTNPVPHAHVGDRRTPTCRILSPAKTGTPAPSAVG